MRRVDDSHKGLVVVPRGGAVVVKFGELVGQELELDDGQVEFHYNTCEYPGKLVIRDAYLDKILYEENLGADRTTDEAKTEPIRQFYLVKWCDLEHFIEACDPLDAATRAFGADTVKRHIVDMLYVEDPVWLGENLPEEADKVWKPLSEYQTCVCLSNHPDYCPIHAA